MMRTLETKYGKEDTQVRPGKMTVSKDKLKSKLDRVIVLILLAFAMFSATMPMAYGQGAGGAAMSGIRNNNAASDIVGPYDKRYKNMAAFRREDQVVNQESVGPGQVIHSTSGPVQVWPVSIPTATSAVPTLRDQAITKNMFQTFGYPLSDTQFQLISRMNDNIATEQLYDPEKAHWMATATAGSASNAAANSMASLAINQALSAIDFCKQFLTNFTAEPNNVWQRIRDQLFVPMAILLLLPGAVLAQVKAIVAQGSPVLVGEIHPFEGLFRSIVAIFLIPGTFLVINYGIDVANSLTYTIANEYFHIFGTDMYEDAKCAIIRAFPMNKPEWNRNSFNVKETPRFEGTGNWAPLEGYTLATARIDPCMGVEESRVPDEDVVQSKNINRMMMNGLNDTATISWNLACAFQMAFLYYLWCMGPVAAALWVWPVQALRGALSSWIDGVITVCFWSLFWNTTILLMACFRGVGDSGTIIMTALIFLAVNSVKSAFDFAGLASAAVQDAAAQAQKVASSAKGGGAGGGSGGSSGGASQGSKAGSGNTGSPAGPQGIGSAGNGNNNTAVNPSQGGQQIGASGNQGSMDTGTSSPIGGAESKAGLGEGVAAANAGKAGGDNTRGLGAVGDVDMPPPAAGDGDAVGGSGSGSGSGSKGAGDAAGMPPMGDIGGAAAAAGGSIDSSVSVAHDFAGMPGGSADSLSVNTNNGGGGGGGSLASGADAAKGGMESLLNTGAGGMLAGAAGAAAGNILGGNEAGVGGIPQALAGFDTAKADFLGDSKASPINLDLSNPANSLGGNFAAAIDGNQGSRAGGEVFGAATADGNSPISNDHFKLNGDGQPILSADGKPMLDTSNVGPLPALNADAANINGATLARDTATGILSMSGVTYSDVAAAVQNPGGPEAMRVAELTGVSAPVLSAAIGDATHVPSSGAGAVAAAAFGGTDTATQFAAPGIQNDIATMSIATHNQAQIVAGGDSGMLARAASGTDMAAAERIYSAPAVMAQFASGGGYNVSAPGDSGAANYTATATGSYSTDVSASGATPQNFSYAAGDSSMTVNNSGGALPVATSWASGGELARGSGGDQSFVQQSVANNTVAYGDQGGIAPQSVAGSTFSYGDQGGIAPQSVAGNSVSYGDQSFVQQSVASNTVAYGDQGIAPQAVGGNPVSYGDQGGVAPQTVAGNSVSYGDQGGIAPQPIAGNPVSYGDQSFARDSAGGPVAYGDQGGIAPQHFAGNTVSYGDQGGVAPQSVAGNTVSYGDQGGVAPQSVAGNTVSYGDQGGVIPQSVAGNTVSYGGQGGVIPQSVAGNTVSYGDQGGVAPQSVAGNTVSYGDQGGVIPQSVAGNTVSYGDQGGVAPQSVAGNTVSYGDQGGIAPQSFAGNTVSYGDQGAVVPQSIAGNPASYGDQNFARESVVNPVAYGGQGGVAPQSVAGNTVSYGDQGGIAPQPVAGSQGSYGDQGYGQQTVANNTVAYGDQGGIAPQSVAGNTVSYGDQGGVIPQSVAGNTVPYGDQGGIAPQNVGGNVVAGGQGLAPQNFNYNTGQELARGGTGEQLTGQQPAGQQYVAGNYVADSSNYTAPAGSGSGSNYVADNSGYITPAYNAPADMGQGQAQGQGQGQAQGYVTPADQGYVQPTKVASSDSGYSQANYVSPSGNAQNYDRQERSAGGPVVDNSGGYAQAAGQIGGANTWSAPEVMPDNSLNNSLVGPMHETAHAPEHQAQQNYAEQQYTEQQRADQSQRTDGGTYVADSSRRTGATNAFTGALGAAASIRAGGAGDRPAGGAPGAKGEIHQKEGAPPTQQAAVNKGLDPQAAKRTGKTKAQIEAELAEDLRRQGQDMPGSDGMA